MARRAIGILVAATCAALLAASDARAISIPMVGVGQPGNRADWTSYGSVASPYRIGRYEVTNAEYAAFLNAVAASDPAGLYNGSMGSSQHGGIERIGNEGHYRYETRIDMANRPINYVSYYDSLRFINWLENGQPVGPQGPDTTERGSYTLVGDSVIGPRIDGATYFLPSEDQWYKAAFFDPVEDDYWLYPTGYDEKTACVAPTDAPNSANCQIAFMTVSDVGAYANAVSPYGTYDQGGNVFEWIEAEIDDRRATRGGSWLDPPDTFYLSSLYRSGHDPSTGSAALGFRIASVPEPGAGLLVAFGLALLSTRRRIGGR